jgi:hypothetical protein
MFEKQSSAVYVTAEDQQLAEQYTGRATVAAISPVVTDADIAAAIANSGEISHGGHSSIRVSTPEPARTLQVGRENPAAYVLETRLESLAGRAEFHVEQLRLLTDAATGGPRAGCEREWNVHSMNLRQMQLAAKYDAAMMEAKQRSAAADASRGLPQLQAEAEYQARKAQDATARQLDSMFGSVRII